MTENLPAHSPLGASGAERWLNCPGSVALLKRLDLPESDDPDYRKLGTAAHAAAAHLIENQMDAWEIVGLEFEGVEVDAEMAEAIQVHKDVCCGIIDRGTPLGRPTFGDQHFLEQKLSAPGVHANMFGTVDFGHIGFDPDLWPERQEYVLDIVDYKHGEGVYVEVEDNPQLKYYAFLLLQALPEGLRARRDLRVRLRIVQPRIAWAEPVRMWETTVGEILDWVETVLVPGMQRTETDPSLLAGDWCRFCPAKLICPVMTGLFGAAATANPQEVITISDESLGRDYPLIAAVKSRIKALEDEVYRRNMLGANVPNTKLVAKKANRVWKSGGPEVVKARFGDAALSKPEVLSPAKIEELGPGAKEVVKEWAFTPQTGLTVALASDNRPAVKVQTTQEAFGAAVAALTSS